MALCTTFALSISQNLLATLESLELKNNPCFLCYKSKINVLQQSVKTVKDILLNVEGKENEANETQVNGILLLKDAIYDVDDRIDEFVTLVELKQHMSNEGRKASQKVCPLFSCFNHIVAYKILREAKKIGEKLDVITNHHSLHNFRFGNQFSQLHKQNIIRRKDTSFVNEGVIFGREEDKEKIVSILIDSDIQRDNVSFLTIIGVEGIGKTTLARLVYNDERVTSAFVLRFWTRVFNNEHGQLGVEIIACESIGKFSMCEYKGQVLFKEDEKKRLGELLASTKCLLVLDDVLIKNNQHWRELVDVLSKGSKGSWILVTTHFHEIPRVVESGIIHKLEGLPAEKSWELFKMMAFGSKQSNHLDDELVTIGNEIVKRCVGVPLVIRVVGSLLYGKNKSNWLSLRDNASSILKECQKDILPILKHSYDKLEFPLKSCFTYCALFPKDYVIKKEVLKRLWVAQGYIVTFDNEYQTIEDVAEEYFSILLRRCFFQDVEYDECGGILSCKIHSLIHDIAHKVLGNQICVSNIVTDVDYIKVWHLSYASKIKHYSFVQNHARSFLCLDMLVEDVDHLLKSRTWKWLRVLKLSSIKNLVESIGDFIHLRYLDLSSNEELKELPLSIVKLYNLQTLKLTECRSLKTLPNNLNKLKKLKVLDIEGCNELNSMPKGMDKFGNLHTLSTFVVSTSSNGFNPLNELKQLNNLKGKLHIKIHENYVEAENDAKDDGDYLKRKKHLYNIFIESEKVFVGETGLLKKMQPHHDLKVLEISGLITVPSWVADNNFEHLPNFMRLKLEGHWLENNLVTFLPNLIKLRLFFLKMEKSNYIAYLGHLPHLKELILHQLRDLKYIFESSQIAVNTNANTFPLLYQSLEILRLYEIFDLEGWKWRSGVVGRENNYTNVEGTKVSPLRLGALKELVVYKTPNLIAIFQCPVLENLSLNFTNMNLQVMTDIEVGDEKGITCNDPRLKKFTVHIPYLRWFNMTKLNFHALAYLKIYIENGSFMDLHEEHCDVFALWMFRKIANVFHTCSSSLQYLSISTSKDLNNIVFGGLEHLTVLKELYISGCSNWNVNEGDKEDGTPWKPPFRHSLFHLTLSFDNQIDELPKWIQFLTSLQTLKIKHCQGLKSLPKWMSKLISLKILNIWVCSKRLHERCQQATGEDWPYIEHIPFIIFDRSIEGIPLFSFD